MEARRLLQVALALAAALCCVWASQCRLQCEYLPLIPPVYSFEGRDIPNHGIICFTKYDCSIDLERVLNNYTSWKTELDLHPYVSLDIYFKCEWAKDRFGKSIEYGVVRLTQRCSIKEITTKTAVFDPFNPLLLN